MSESEQELLTGKARSLANLKKWQPGGPSPNPTGRKPRATFVAELASVLAEPVVEGDLSSPSKMHAVAEKLVELCLSGNVKALAVFLPHVDPQRLRNAIRTTGNVNVLNIGGDSVDDVKDSIEAFVSGLPRLLGTTHVG